MKISQAVGMGFLIMGAIGYFIKLSECSSEDECLVGRFWLTAPSYP
jgi:hypothetical protein